MNEGAPKLPILLRKLVAAFLRYRCEPELLLANDHFDGQRVMLVGPARTVHEDISSLDPRSYDLIIRMNNGLGIRLDALGRDALRCDVLFHSLSSDTRPLSQEMLDRCGVALIVHRTPTKTSIIQTVAARRRFGPDIRVRCLPFRRYRALAKQLGGKSPTTGLVATDFLSDCNLAELTVVGFTFFETAYCAGYDDRVSCDEEARKRIVAKAHHDPSREIGIFAERLRRLQAKGTPVRVGRGVGASLERADELL